MDECRLCRSETKYLFHRRILNKHIIGYMQCTVCHSLQTEKPFWLAESYVDENEKYDTGQVFRSITNAALVFALADIFNLKNEKILDYGCGAGLLVRLLRDAGLNAYGFDQYSIPRLCIAFHEHELLGGSIINACEVVQHFENPKDDFDKLFIHKPLIVIISTTLYNGEGSSWYYLASQHGQHIFFYSKQAMELIGRKYGYFTLFLDEYTIYLKTNLAEKLFISNGSGLTDKVKTQLQNRNPLFLNSIINCGYHFPIVDSKKIEASEALPQSIRPIVIDGIIFQLYPIGGIARVWLSIMTEWILAGYNNFILLNRGGTAPNIPGAITIDITKFDFANIITDRQMLENICSGIDAKIFISTYYTIPISTPSLFYLYDMIPELFNWNLNEPVWQMKNEAINHATKFASISHSSANDLCKFYPNIIRSDIDVIHIGVRNVNLSDSNLLDFKTKYNITKPYYLLITPRRDYKNAQLFFNAFEKFGDVRKNFGIFCTGYLDKLFLDQVGEAEVNIANLTETELFSAYTNAIALVYPSAYEGFGLPILEAMSCGCPVIACPTSSIPEVAGEFAIYVEKKSEVEMQQALIKVIDKEQIKSLIENAKIHSQKFSWQTTAKLLSQSINNM